MAEPPTSAYETMGTYTESDSRHDKKDTASIIHSDSSHVPQGALEEIALEGVPLPGSMSISPVAGVHSISHGEGDNTPTSFPVELHDDDPFPERPPSPLHSPVFLPLSPTSPSVSRIALEPTELFQHASTTSFFSLTTFEDSLSPAGSFTPPVSTLSSVSSVTSTDLTPTGVPTKSVPSLSGSLYRPPISEPQAVLQWGLETDGAYESSILGASISTQSLPIAEGVDTTFETSVLRPTDLSEELSGGVSPPILAMEGKVVTTPDVSSPSPSPSISLTPEVPLQGAVPSIRTPSSISYPTNISTRSLTPTERESPTVTVMRTLSTVTTVSSVPLSPFAVPTRSPTPSARPSTQPSLLSTHASPIYVPASLPTIPSESSPSSSAGIGPPVDTSPPAVTMAVEGSPGTAYTPPSPSMYLSVTTPHGDTPSIASLLETIPSETPERLPRRDLNSIWECIREMEIRRRAESTELASSLQGVRDLAESLRDRRREHLDVNMHGRGCHRGYLEGEFFHPATRAHLDNNLTLVAARGNRQTTPLAFIVICTPL
ncbi:uncharacterized protein C8Q71DRAFT_862991 [Rhodofomes roseus]|uniref:Uncharacterized protein n=1 Tax=Rhodofomes roseus TaxID=34475 RepID=A0ABQ8JZT3_9APHY|nr:uncharacterized protein C8Q71DRAFT_863875 [Rhodofomes roseus]XP_047773269.1 uncharacterized protein C8Q71DRAFT_862991 [Rhodofomes roseus]KAH9828590.1 hypothetical protein C8Q71DRAFT_863875 [Rhodofomes roseus]KAH9829906.1 hypothetical protein C8Q71DRAFT_862991 [Rhodofomes roseus]